MFQLPVSGISVTLRQPTGRDDLLLLESSSTPLSACLSLAESLVLGCGEQRVEWNDLTLTDLEASMLLLRQATLGNTVRAETRCVRSECGARVDADFRVHEYLSSQTPRTPNGVESHKEGWFGLTGEDVRFRLPRCRDVAVVTRQEISSNRLRGLLLRRCVEPQALPHRLWRRIDRAMEALAAPLSGDLAGTCPECQVKLTFHFEVLPFVLREMRDQAASLFQDIHLLATHYSWPEEKILELPRKRRLHYAEMIRSERSVA